MCVRERICGKVSRHLYSVWKKMVWLLACVCVCVYSVWKVRVCMCTSVHVGVCVCVCVCVCLPREMGLITHTDEAPAPIWLAKHLCFFFCFFCLPLLCIPRYWRPLHRNIGIWMGILNYRQQCTISASWLIPRTAGTSTRNIWIWE